FHFSNACKKLGATNRYQAITKAILGGYINPYL
ncbi:transcriptional regulator, partial [Vibrio anguillarum]|nr:transcriptional regulator [Vibrio anguillarum]